MADSLQTDLPVIRRPFPRHLADTFLKYRQVATSHRYAATSPDLEMAPQ